MIKLDAIKVASSQGSLPSVSAQPATSAALKTIIKADAQLHSCNCSSALKFAVQCIIQRIKQLQFLQPPKATIPRFT